MITDFDLVKNDTLNCWQPIQQWTFWPNSTLTTNLSRCNWCQGAHAGKCPMLKAIEYHENGTVKRVEFFGS